jgi:hypothetical protein
MVKTYEKKSKRTLGNNVFFKLSIDAKVTSRKGAPNEATAEGSNA